MRAIDTNVIIRLLTKDDEAQNKAAEKLIKAGDIFVSLTVILECEWVLRSAYRFTTEQIANGLTLFAGLTGIEMEDRIVVSNAIEWMLGGMDFADAMHLAKADGCTAFVTFDKKLAKTAKGRSAISVEAP